MGLPTTLNIISCNGKQSRSRYIDRHEYGKTLTSPTDQLHIVFYSRLKAYKQTLPAQKYAVTL